VAIRALVGATLHGGYGQPSDVDSVVADLEGIAGDLPQALIQIGRWLDHQAADGQVGDDRGGDPCVAVNEVHAHLGAATDLAARLACALHRAHQATAHLTGTSGDTEDPGVADSEHTAIADRDTDEVTAR
jgi:hypothetical protein